jgi:hypothetical protein
MDEYVSNAYRKTKQRKKIGQLRQNITKATTQSGAPKDK